MILAPGWEQSGTVQKSCEGSSWGYGFILGPGTRPAWVEVSGRSGPPWEFHAKLGQALARLLVGQVFSEDVSLSGS